mmetsp:Transcript_17714/g.35348  ORF Transcript_17714/g.35348 Transcript_17714/m.35348 type:complete len:397 (-) Transcript_17714:270-1460(-)
MMLSSSIIILLSSVALQSHASLHNVIISNALLALDIRSNTVSSGPTSPNTKSTTAIEFIDCHHHFYDTKNNDFHKFLQRFNPDGTYLPGDYRRDVVRPIDASESPALAQFRHAGSVHVESMPDDGAAEARWVGSLPSTTVAAIVASCDLSGADADDELRKIVAASPSVRGVRWMLDYVGPHGTPGNEATHVATLRHAAEPGGPDLLRSDGGHVSPAFERGYALLTNFSLRFDLQCAPCQLLAAAELCARYPGVPVAVCHLGAPFQLLGRNNAEMAPSEEKLAEWRTGMRAMAALPHVYVKISRLGWALPNWTSVARRVNAIRGLCQETVEMFGPERCMVATNWFADAVAADSDGVGETGPRADEYLEYMMEFFTALTLEEKRMLFGGTAKEFYGIE